MPEFKPNIENVFRRASVGIDLFHLEKHTSIQHLLQTYKKDGFAKEYISSKDGLLFSNFLSL